MKHAEPKFSTHNHKTLLFAGWYALLDPEVNKVIRIMKENVCLPDAYEKIQRLVLNTCQNTCKSF